MLGPEQRFHFTTEQVKTQKVETDYEDCGNVGDRMDEAIADELPDVTSLQTGNGELQPVRKRSRVKQPFKGGNQNEGCGNGGKQPGQRSTLPSRVVISRVVSVGEHRSGCWVAAVANTSHHPEAVDIWQ